MCVCVSVFNEGDDVSSGATQTDNLIGGDNTRYCSHTVIEIISVHGTFPVM